MQVKAIFIYSGQTSNAELASHSGQRCEVIRPLPATEVDKENQPMFEIRFDDGFVGHAFCEELIELPDYPLIDLESFKVYLDGIESYRRGITKRDNPWYEASLLNTRLKRTYYAIWNRGWDEAEKAGYMRRRKTPTRRRRASEARARLGDVSRLSNKFVYKFLTQRL